MPSWKPSQPAGFLQAGEAARQGRGARRPPRIAHAKVANDSGREHARGAIILRIASAQDGAPFLERTFSGSRSVATAVGLLDQPLNLGILTILRDRIGDQPWPLLP